jgi:FtsP/CotA-like multicopper oxidase with cupredoxin domain
MNRRSFLRSASGVMAQPLLHSLVPASSGLLLAAQQNTTKKAASKSPRTAADHSLTIQPCTLEISPGVNIKTVAYNGQVPGPLLRLRQGVPVTIDVTNATEREDIVHWHGLTTDSHNDGAMEEGSPMIPPGGHLRYSLATPNPAGSRWYHTHAGAGANLSDRHLHRPVRLPAGRRQPAIPATTTRRSFWPSIIGSRPSFPWSRPCRPVGQPSANLRLRRRLPVRHHQPHRLGAGEPIRVKQGQKVLMRLLNASATENVFLALPGHTFRVIAMDGNPVPIPRRSKSSIAVAERVDAIVEMKSPGVWVLGSTLEKSRQMGLGIVVEYAGKTGPPVWKDPQIAPGTTRSSPTPSPLANPDETIMLALMDLGPQKDSKFDTWAINGQSWPNIDPLKVQKGKRYRLTFQNTSGDQHPMHLHRHTFEVVSIGDKNISGLKKDVVNVMPLDTVAVDFVADNPGDTLLHCHMQLHMDFGFMQLIRYVT